MDERTAFNEILYNIAKEGSYENKRKLSRALPYLYDIDRELVKKVLTVLRGDTYKGNTDIRRRTIEAALTIIQKSGSGRESRRRYHELKEVFGYKTYDDAYTSVACIESYFYLYTYVAKNKRQKRRISDEYNKLRAATVRAVDAEVGKVDEKFKEEIDDIWTALSDLVTVSKVENENYKQAKTNLEEIINGSSKYPKLAIIKNLYYSCPCYPRCLVEKNCTVGTSSYMMNKILGFLTQVQNNDIFLAMPTVRYFDCVCNNVRSGDAKDISKHIIFEYFNHDNLLIMQTAFDKFAKLVSTDKKFASEIAHILLDNLTEQAEKNINDIKTIIEGLDENKRSLYEIYHGRLKVKFKYDYCNTRLSVESDEELCMINDKINEYHDEIKFIGKVKKLIEEREL